MKIDRLDHLVLTVADIDTTARFYESALGIEAVTFASGRKALAFGNTKLNYASFMVPPELADFTKKELDYRNGVISSAGIQVE